MSIHIPLVPFTSLEGILSTPYQITLLKDSSYENMFKTASKEPLKTIWNTKFIDKEKSLLKTPEEMIPLILTGDYAMYETYGAFQNFEETKDCRITDVGFHVIRNDFAFPIPKSSPYGEVLNFVMRKMIETGILKR